VSWIDLCHREESLDGDVALFSPCQRYRYMLTRGESASKATGSLGVVMLNPSTADAFEDDPTITRLRGFAARWGFDRLIVANLFAFRSPNPRDLKTAADPVGPLNDQALQWLLGSSVVETVLAAWGAAPIAASRAAAVCRIAAEAGVELACLRISDGGAPMHPMARGKHRIPDDAPMMIWQAACYCVRGVAGLVWCPTHGSCEGCDRENGEWHPGCPLHGEGSNG
jgi:hypothetical protein